MVTRCGHHYGYRTRDLSRNTLPLDAPGLGELLQSNHDARPASPNLAVRRFELDPTWQVRRLLARLELIRLVHAPPATRGRRA